MVVCGAHVGTAAAWAATTKTIEEGIIAIETDTKKMKIGSDLSYASTPYFYDPTAPIKINSTSGTALAIISPNTSTGPSDTDPFLSVRSPSGNDGWGHRWTSTTGDYQITRTTAGVTTAPITILKASNALVLGNASPNETVRILSGTNTINYFRFVGSTTDGAPVTLQALSTVTGSTANIPIDIRVIGNSYFRVAAQATGNTLFRVEASADRVNGLIVNPGATGSGVGYIANGSDTNIGHQFVSKGNGLFQVGGGYPSWYPVFQVDPNTSSSTFLNISNTGNILTMNSYPYDAISPTHMHLFPGGGAGGSIRIDGKLGFGLTPIDKPTVSGTFTDLNSLKDIVYALGSAINNLGLVSFTAS
jgi:hypothetical protein